MIETFTALFFGHLLVECILLPPKILDDPARLRRRIARRAFLTLIVVVAAVGVLHPAVFAPAFARLAIDALRPGTGLRIYLGRQAAHLAVILVTAALVPGLWDAGFWAVQAPGLPVLMAHVGGAILATRSGQVAVGLLMAAHTLADAPEDGLPRGGATIGLLERGLIFVLVLAGEIGAIGFLIAAKSILRFGTVNQDRAASEYVIIGTLASFGWAVLAALGTRELVMLLSAA